MARKLFIVSLSGLASGGMQLVWGGVVLGLALMFNVIYTPFSNPLMNRLETMCLGALYATVVFGILYSFVVFFVMWNWENTAC